MTSTSLTAVEEVSLEVLPTVEDINVQSFLKKLDEELLLKQFNLSLRRVGLFHYIANLATAQKSSLLIKVQNALLDILKLVDTSAVMLQSFQGGSVNVVEKLKVAFLYLLDGFPEFAKTDIEAISKDIKSMKEQVEKTKEATEKNSRTISNIIEEVKKEQEMCGKKHSHTVNTSSEQESYQDQRGDQRTLTQSNGPGGSSFFELCGQCCKLTSSTPHQVHVRQNPCDGNEVVSNQPQPQPRPSEKSEDEKNEEELLLELTLVVMEKSGDILDSCIGTLDRLLGKVQTWYTESKEAVTPSMADNVRRAEGMSEEERTAFWQTLTFKKEVQGFYSRWIALKFYCEDTRTRLKIIRAEIEGWYVDNPRPRDAVEKAWVIAKKAEDRNINKIVQDREQRIRIDDAARAITNQ